MSEENTKEYRSRPRSEQAYVNLAAAHSLRKYCYAVGKESFAGDREDLIKAMSSYYLEPYKHLIDWPSVIEDLVVDHLIEYEQDRFAGMFYLFQPVTLGRLEKEMFETASLIGSGARFGEKWIIAAVNRLFSQAEEMHLPVDEADLATVPASDRIVSKSDNRAEWDETLGSLDAAIDAIENEKSLDNELGPEKPALLNALKAGRSLFEDTKIKVDIAIAMTLEPLKVAADRYKDVAIGGLIVKAIDVITDFLGKAL